MVLVKKGVKRVNLKPRFTCFIYMLIHRNAAGITSELQTLKKLLVKNGQLLPHVRDYREHGLIFTSRLRHGQLEGRVCHVSGDICLMATSSTSGTSPTWVTTPRDHPSLTKILRFFRISQIAEPRIC